MNLYRIPVEKWWSHAHAYHVLTFAEMGPAPLEMHGEAAGLRRPALMSFTLAVNAGGRTMTLHPGGPISAVPRAAVRGSDGAALVRGIAEFLALNSESIRAPRVAIDLRLPNLPRFAEGALQRALGATDPAPITAICVIE